MEKIRIIIIEDEFVIAEDIRATLEQFGYEVLDIISNGESALREILGRKPDMVLADIQLAGPMSGIEVVAEAQKSFRFPFIYITANSDVATYEKARSTHPHAFLVKPFTAANLLIAVDLALYHFSKDSMPANIERPHAKELEIVPFVVNDALFIKSNGKYKKVHCCDMMYVEAAGSYVHVQTKHDRFTMSQNLSHFQRKINLPNLIRIHRSYIVNINHIDSFDDSCVFISNHKLPISDNFKAEFLSRVRCI